MGSLNPHLRDVLDFQHKLWDQLFIMSDFRLEVRHIQYHLVGVATEA
jgi:hypothetical protein